MQNISLYKIHQSTTIRKAIKIIDKGGIGFSVCVDDDDKVIENETGKKRK